MVQDDLPAHVIELKHETRLERGNETVEYMKLVFFLGKFGPYTERYPLATFSDDQPAQTYERYRATIRAAC